MSYNKYIDTIGSFLTFHLDRFLIGIVIVSIVTLIALIFVLCKLSRVVRKIDNLTAGMEGKNIEEIIALYGSRAKKSNEVIEEFERKIKKMERENAMSIKKVYSKRYKAFDDIGSDLSFSVTLLNDDNDGVLITSIYGRDESRVYLKPIRDGISSYRLSPEESEVLNRTINLKY
jgi:hypothetical protein